MKILWLSNVEFSDVSLRGSGTWLQPMAEGLLDRHKDLTIVNVTEGVVTEIKMHNVGKISQFVIPRRRDFFYTHRPQHQSCANVARILDETKPDLVHIWGTESIWAQMHPLGVFKGYKLLLDIQGLLYTCSEAYYANLTFTQVLRSLSFKDLLLPFRSMQYCKYVYGVNGEIEKKSLASFTDISYQSEWVYGNLQLLNNKATYHPTKILLRRAFYDKADSWKCNSDGRSPILLTVCSGPIPYKGLHVLLQAVREVKKMFPDVELRIAGEFKSRLTSLLNNGYFNFLIKLIKKYDIKDNVKFIGKLDEHQIIEEEKSADVFIVPSFVESYCLVLAEAMIVGIPCVVSYAGALPNLAEDEREALFYSPSDYHICAFNICRLLNNRALSSIISKNAVKRRLKDNDPDDVIDTQMNIYKELLKSKL